jgi:hypothetical protein
MPRRKTVIVLSAGLVLTCSGVIYGFNRATEPVSYPIFLEPAGSPRHEASERDVCAMWLGVMRSRRVARQAR